ncbi:hypothetical protein ACR79B_11225 [Sphingobacterium spiritivorum]|uniref:hypothetical protein n=1 Tax=Sphingobacterium spiritivorum TaxID=258 RepID=UPI003DA6AAF6
MINEQFSLMQLLMAGLSSGVVSSCVTYFTSRKQNLASVDETVRKTLGDVIIDLRNQIGFLQEQIVSGLAREKDYLALIAQVNNDKKSLQAEVAAGALQLKNLEQQKAKFEQKLAYYEDLYKRTEAHSKV